MFSVGCTPSYTSTTTLKADTAYLKFTGRVKEITISINDGKEFSFNPKIDLYEVKPGKVSVKVYRGDRILVDRTIFVDNHATFEVNVP